MQTHDHLADTELAAQFEACSLDPALFNHEAHLRLAWIHVHQYGVEQAIENIRQQLIRFVERAGARNKYNETVTVAAIRTVNHFYQQSAATDFTQFIQEFPRLKTHFHELLTFHYATDIFNSPEAKVRFLEPELQPF